MQEWPIPEQVKHIWQFLGFASYYWEFILKFTEKVVPLQEIMNIANKKGKHYPGKIECTPECDKAFQVIKKALVSAPVLGFPKREGTFILDTDASGKCIAPVLSQIQNGKPFSSNIF